MVVVLSARSYIAYIFTSNKEMQEAVSSLAYLLGATMLLNSVQPVLLGIYRLFSSLRFGIPINMLYVMFFQDFPSSLA